MSSIGWHSYVLRWEAERPEAPGLIGPNETLNFRQLAWRGRKFAAGLHRAGVMRGQVVMVRARRDYDFQLTLALSMLGAIAVSNTAKQYLDFEPQTDWLVTRTPVPDYPREKQIVVDEPWIQRAFNSVEPYQILGLESEDSLERICLTSGTTGRPKALAFSHRIHHKRVQALEEALDTHGPELYLMDLGAAVGALRAFAAPLYGLPYLHLGDRSAESLVKVFTSARVERLAGSPLQVAETLRLLSQKRVSTQPLKSVRIGGARVPASLITQVKAIPGVALQIGYGSTEAGPSTYKLDVTQPSGLVGYPMPGVIAEVIDPHGNPLAAGEVGQLRIRTEYAASGYWQESDSGSGAFSGEWFYPGDVARIDSSGELELLGREDDLLNFGGVKVDPVEVEELAKAALNVTELAVVQFEDLAGKVGLCLAVVNLDRSDTKGFEKLLGKKYKVDLKVRYLVLADLPRNAAGKVLRAQLAELARSRFA